MYKEQVFYSFTICVNLLVEQTIMEIFYDTLFPALLIKGDFKESTSLCSRLECILAGAIHAQSLLAGLLTAGLVALDDYQIFRSENVNEYKN